MVDAEDVENVPGEARAATDQPLILVRGYGALYRSAIRLLWLIALILALQTGIMVWREGRYWNSCWMRQQSWEREVAKYPEEQKPHPDDKPTFWRCVTT